MAVDILIETNWNNHVGGWQKGDIVAMKQVPFTWGKKEGMPRFVKVTITDANYNNVQIMVQSVFNAQKLVGSWVQSLNWDVVNSNPSIDGWRLRLYTENSGSSDKGQVTKNQVERFINKWNGDVVSFGSNSVTFDDTIYSASTSPAFWERGVSQINFTELDYTQVGGIHRIEIDYSAIDIKPTLVENQVLRRGGEIISHIGDTIVIDITRSDALKVFKKSLKFHTERTVSKSQFRVPEATVDNIISQGGEITATIAQLQSFLINRLDE